MEGFDSEDEEAEETVTTTTYFFDHNTRQLYKEMDTTYWGLHYLKRIGCSLSVHPNGLEEENEGYVSIMLKNVDGNCIISVIDASETQRFSQSFALSFPEDRVFIIDKFISHKQLLSDPGDLLPGGVLKLMINIRFTFHYRAHEEFPLLTREISSFQLKVMRNFRKVMPPFFELLLDSPFAKRLSEESNVFREMLEMPLSDNGRRSIHIFEDEYGSLLNVSRLLLGCNPLPFKSITEIFGMFFFADKYDVPFVSDTSTCFMKLYAFMYGIDELFEASDEYVKNEYLKELLKNQISLIRQTNFVEEIDKTYINFLSLKQPVHGCLWVYIGKRGQCHSFLNQMEAVKYEKDNEYDFYK